MYFAIGGRKVQSGLYRVTYVGGESTDLFGILLFLFFQDSVSAMLPSIIAGGATLRRLAFPPILIPLAASVPRS